LAQGADRDRDGNSTPPAGAGWKPAGETRPRRCQRGRRDQSDRSRSQAARRVPMFETRGQRHWILRQSSPSYRDQRTAMWHEPIWPSQSSLVWRTSV